jgi:hypothetical protein
MESFNTHRSSKVKRDRERERLTWILDDVHVHGLRVERAQENADALDAGHDAALHQRVQRTSAQQQGSPTDVMDIRIPHDKAVRVPHVEPIALRDAYTTVVDVDTLEDNVRDAG